MAQNTNKALLLEQLKNTHNTKNWFVPLSTALEGLNAEQAAWTDGKNHSAGQLAHHLLFWNERQLRDFKGETNPEFTGTNDETFTKFNEKQWSDLVKQLDRVLTALEQVVEKATDAQIEKWAPTLANIAAHNAYHTGQIVAIRKQQDVWDAEKGVK